MVDLASYWHCNHIIELAYLGVDKRHAEQSIVKRVHC